MTQGEIVIMGFIAFLSAGLGTLFWTRMHRLEERFSTVASAAEFGELRREVREDIGVLRSEFGELRRVRFVRTSECSGASSGS
ncbi:MAG: hypothetical protein H0V97_00075 [Actinobacteria bacterium]|nr:hypothetical protein [Actinomycetota bacterium]